VPLSLRTFRDKTPESEEQPVDLYNLPSSDVGQMNQLRRQQQIEQEEEESVDEGPTAAEKKAEKEQRPAQRHFQQVTGELLRQAWIAVPSTFGLSMLYVWFHMIMRYIAGSTYFSRFGILLNVKNIASKGTGVATSTDTDPSTAGEYGEIVTAIGIFLAIVALVFIALMMVGVTVYGFTHPVQASIAAGKLFITKTWSTLVDSFKTTN
jgi:hypothetical protein